MDKLQINIDKLGNFKDLAELLFQNIELLPDFLATAVSDAVSKDDFELDADWFNMRIAKMDFYSGDKLDRSAFSVIADGVSIDHVASVNTLLKRVTYEVWKNGRPETVDGNFRADSMTPKKLQCRYRGELLVGWGLDSEQVTL
ncbi:MAG: hypothetical protein ACJAYB_000073 [Psychromonas sp.]|jgi:hypothetical protein